MFAPKRATTSAAVHIQLPCLLTTEVTYHSVSPSFSTLAPNEVIPLGQSALPVRTPVLIDLRGWWLIHRISLVQICCTFPLFLSKFFFYEYISVCCILVDFQGPEIAVLVILSSILVAFREMIWWPPSVMPELLAYSIFFNL